MKLPSQAKPVTRHEQHASYQAEVQPILAGIRPSGCCAQVCVPGIGYHCVAESPFC